MVKKEPGEYLYYEVTFSSSIFEDRWLGRLIMLVKMENAVSVRDSNNDNEEMEDNKSSLYMNSFLWNLSFYVII